MAAYIIAQIEVTDPEQYAKYTSVTPSIIKRFGGRFLVRGGKTVVLEGETPASRIVVLEFPSLKEATDFYNSNDYAAAKALRATAAQASFIAIDGVEET